MSDLVTVSVPMTTDPSGFTVPRGAKSLQAVAESHGWMVSALTFCRGPWPYRRDFRQADSCVMRMRRWRCGGSLQRLYVTWIDAKFHGAATADLLHFPTLTALKTYLAERPS